MLGLLALSEGDHAAAARELGAAAALLEDMGYRHPGAFPVLPDAVEALACSGELDEAGALLARLEREAAAVDSAWALAACERCRGVLALAAGDAEAAVEPLERAAASVRRARPPPGRRARRLPRRARAAAERAPEPGRRRLRRRPRALRGDRRRALGGARGRGARAGVAGPRRRASLTPAERRIAELVAEGMRNREIGQALFMSVGTVEAHLTRIYRKLGIRSRSELARLVTDQPGLR